MIPIAGCYQPMSTSPPLTHPYLLHALKGRTASERAVEAAVLQLARQPVTSLGVQPANAEVLVMHPFTQDSTGVDAIPAARGDGSSWHGRNSMHSQAQWPPSTPGPPSRKSMRPT